MTTITGAAPASHFLDTALMFADAGVSVFPLASGTDHLTGGPGLLDASTDPAQITAWWGENPSANVGIPTGPQSWDVLDVDISGSMVGKAAWECLVDADLAAYPSLIARTHRGWHAYFEPTPGARSTLAAWGLRVRSAGDYIVAPGSVVNAQKYAVDTQFNVNHGALDWPACRTFLEHAMPLTGTNLSVPAQGTARVTRRAVKATAASSFAPRRVDWLWEGRLARGSFALLAGPEGLGKSTLAAHLAARVTRGELEGALSGDPRGVLLCATEDSWEHTIVPRLMAAGADLDRVFRVEVRTSDDLPGALVLPLDLEGVATLAQQHDAALLILDPVTSRLGDLDTHKDSEVRQALEPLAAVADQTGMTVLGLMHHNKSGSTDPLQLVMGSKAFTAVARSVHMVVSDPDDETNTRRLFGTPKNNLGRSDLPTLAFRVVSYSIPVEDGEAITGRLEWLDSRAESIRDVLARSVGSDGDRTQVGDAADWLRGYMDSQGGKVLSKDAKNAAWAEGHAQATLDRARHRLGITTVREGYPSRTWWVHAESLPRATPPPSHLTSVASTSWGDGATEMSESTGETRGFLGGGADPVTSPTSVESTPAGPDATGRAPVETR